MMEAAMIIRRMEEELRSDYQIELVEASTPQIHKALSNAVMYAISDNWRKARREHEHVRRAYYFSAEYLMGRMVFNNLYCLGILDQIRDLLRARGCDIASMEDIEDAALGNGGLGRLAACFLDSAATHDLPLDGYGLRYKFGLFKQSFKNGYQCEKADDWQRYGDPWSRRRDDKTVEITFADQKVMAVPYDMPIVGYGTDNIGTLRLWQSEPLEEFDFNLFNEQEYDLAVREKNKVEDITRVLYPNDSTYEGKRLRLKQQYFLSSASLQDIIRRYKRVRGNDLSNFAAHCAIQLNDTHPTVSIPELVRLLMNEGMDFDAAFDITRKTFSYTNHTIMSEALEKWDYDLFMSVVPELVDIISRINEVQNSELRAMGVSQEQIDRMQIATGGQIHMARLAVFASTYVNGVAQIHSDILRHDLFKDWYSVTPDKFQNKTNGITQRRWLGLCNRELSEFITERIGGGFITDLSEISKLKQHMSDADIAAFNTVKQQKKAQLSAVIREKEGVHIPPEFVFDVQVKRLHEYKRQLLNILHVMYLYNEIKEHPDMEFFPRTFIFGAKAAAGYKNAKLTIKLINSVADVINNDASINGKIKVVFIENYRVSNAELIFAAADVSEQISTASKEASGTGNMKFMLNGALTIGTMDGANVEIVEEVGAENAFIFGLSSDEVIHYENCGGYDPMEIFNNDADIRKVLMQLINGTYSPQDPELFRDLYNSLLNTQCTAKADTYFILKDFKSYAEAQKKVEAAYKDEKGWAKSAILNTACSGKFTSDRTIQEYVDDIWKLDKVVLPKKKEVKKTVTAEEK